MIAKKQKKQIQDPPLQLHKASGQGYVHIERQRIYLGKYDLPVTREKYHRLLQEWHANGQRLRVEPGDITVVELIDQFWEYLEAYYGKHASELVAFRYALQPVKGLYGSTRAKDFGPLALEAVREDMIRRGWCRNHINHNVFRVKRLFKWAVSKQLVPNNVWHGLETVESLKLGRSVARESEPVPPIPENHSDVTSRRVQGESQASRTVVASRGIESPTETA